MDSTRNKEHLRVIMKRKRRSMKKSQVVLNSNKIFRIFENHFPLSIHLAHIYLGIRANKEARTEPIVQFMQLNNIELYTGLTRQNDSLVYPLLPSSMIVEDEMGIPTPKEQAILPPQFDLIVVPMLGFDKSGYRLGYGQGLYDKFLGSQPQAKKIGLCYEAGLISETVDWQPHDIAMDSIITEKRILTF